MAIGRTLLIASASVGLLSYVLIIWQLHPVRPAPIVDLGYVKYTGVYKRVDGLNAFYGIKYAEAPSAELRWRAPVPIDRQQNGTIKSLNAYSRGFACPAGPMPLEVTLATPPAPHDEDCLVLDIVVSANPPAQKLPVLVQIHGGGYGTGDSSLFPGDDLVKQAHGGILYVAIQYRLGLFGFLAGDEIKEDGVWNAGLLDQRAALDWIQRHISKFGGDPDRVTIMGASAGGGSVAMQMILYGGEPHPPFQAVISEFPWWTPAYDDSYLNRQYERLLNTTGCQDLACLRALPLEPLHKAGHTTFKEARNDRELASGLFYWGPAVDGTILQDFPVKEFENNHFSKVPLLINHNQFEGLMFTNLSMTTETEAVHDLNIVWPRQSTTTLQKLLSLYPAATYSGALLEQVSILPLLRVLARVDTLWEAFFGHSLLADAVMQRQSMFGDVLINCPTSYMARAVSASGESVYKMIFNGGLRIHGSTVPYLFNEITFPSGYYNGRALLPLFLNQTISDILKDSVISFAIHKDPNTYKSQPHDWHWPTFTLGEENVMELSPAGATTLRDPDANPRCDALKVLMQ